MLRLHSEHKGESEVIEGREEPVDEEGFEAKWKEDKMNREGEEGGKIWLAEWFKSHRPIRRFGRLTRNKGGIEQGVRHGRIGSVYDISFLHAGRDERMSGREDGENQGEKRVPHHTGYGFHNGGRSMRWEYPHRL